MRTAAAEDGAGADGTQECEREEKMEPDLRRNRSRETFLVVSLVLLVGGVIAFTLVFVSMGVFFYVLLAVPIFVVVGFLHYVLWGYSLSQETAGERKQMQLQEEQEDDEFVRRPSPVQDLSRHRKAD
jgi:hypothetical protein